MDAIESNKDFQSHHNIGSGSRSADNTQPDHSQLWRRALRAEAQHGQLSQSRGGVVERWFVTIGCTVGVPDVASTQNSRM